MMLIDSNIIIYASQVYERTLVRRNIEQNIEYKLDGQTDLLFNSCEKSDANAGC